MKGAPFLICTSNATTLPHAYIVMKIMNRRIVQRNKGLSSQEKLKLEGLSFSTCSSVLPLQNTLMTLSWKVGKEWYREGSLNKHWPATSVPSFVRSTKGIVTTCSEKETFFFKEKFFSFERFEMSLASDWACCFCNTSDSWIAAGFHQLERSDPCPFPKPWS